MPPSPPNDRRGPIDDGTWASTLLARVFTPGPRPSMHGYDVHGDLARHYRASDLMLTALTGEPPTEDQSTLFDAALTALSPIKVNEAPGHAAILTRACGGGAPSVVAVGATLLAEQSEAIVAEHAPVLAWLDAPDTPFPELARCRDDAEREVVGFFQARLQQAGIELSILAHDPPLVAAALAALHRCGLTDPDRLVAALVVARLPGLLAEGLFAPVGDRRGYPIDLPPFRYVDHDSEPEP